MRSAGVGWAFLMAFGVTSLDAQQSDQSLSIEVIRQALRTRHSSRQMILPTFTSEAAGSRRLGILTLVDPDPMTGEIVRVVIPIGELTTGLARKISSATRQRRERKAREAVERALRDFQAQSAAK